MTGEYAVPCPLPHFYPSGCATEHDVSSAISTLLSILVLRQQETLILVAYLCNWLFMLLAVKL
jgi:hypothetical protein